MKINENKIDKNTAQVQVIYEKDEIEHVRNEVVDEMIKNITVKGFRQGKAPKSIAEKNLDPDKLSQHVLSHVFNEIVREVVKTKEYKLLGRPVLQKMTPTKDSGWELDLQVPLYPSIKLPDLKKILTKKNSIKKDETDSQKLDSIYDLLLKEVKIDISAVLVEEEVNYSFQRLNDQAKSLNLTLEKYFEAIHKNESEIRKEYSEKAEESIKLDLILLEVAKQEKIDTPENELLALAKTSNIQPNQFEQFRSMINRRKTIDYLLSI